MSTLAPQVSDDRELEDLFDSIALAQVEQNTPAAEPAEPVTASDLGTLDEDSSPENKVFSTVGHLTRQLHDTLAQLGYDRQIQGAAGALPDARHRLAYIATLTEQAASRSLNAVELATPLQESLACDAASLAGRWDDVFRGESDVAQFKSLAEATRDYLQGVSGRTDATRGHLQEIIMAQEFQDLTGQVLKRVMDVANNLENQLLTLLVENTPAPIKRTEALSLLNGPAVGGSGESNVIANQEQVDDLLESLGF